MNYHFKAKTANKKTGPMPVTVSHRATCPPSCPFKDNGCYFEAGFFTKLHWNKIDSGERGGTFTELCESIRAIPDDNIWRHNIGGDLPGDGVKIDRSMLTELTDANTGKNGFTYTHYPMTDQANRDAIRDANRDGFTINLSANNLQHADELSDLKIGPVATVLPISQTENTTTPAGRKVIVCPATQRDDVTCKSCKMCQRQRNTIIGFPAHGTSQKKADLIATTGA
jgi:hypothetical protein